MRYTNFVILLVFIFCVQSCSVNHGVQNTWFGVITNPKNTYDLLYLNSDSTYTYISSCVFPESFMMGRTIKRTSTGHWYKQGKFIYLERSDMRITSCASNDSITTLQFYLITDSTSMPYQNCEINIYSKSQCTSYYTDENGCIRFPNTFKADFVSVGVPSREFVYESGMNQTIYMTLHAVTENACSLWEYKESCLRHPINKRYKLYNQIKHPIINKQPIGIE